MAIDKLPFNVLLFYCVFGHFTDPPQKNFIKFPRRKLFREHVFSLKFFSSIFKRFLAKNARKKAIFGALGGGPDRAGGGLLGGGR